ncbi:hypothetical protein [Jeotgalibacillus salarius]|uniref:Uncharacterized protein n=1 Tax=Jeotgalibacillus salarius TaxID=546023 RepID=A0A4Y8LDM5_9BACL|nr:hypothetical protein [Jeotgalibacillus salarius]TFE00255.1 hypothetical protein E2626_12290 [Jeotgalibacillus salarius]
MHVVVILLVITLIVVYFIPGGHSEKEFKDEGWIVAAIVTALVTYGLIELAREDELKEMTLADLREALNQNEELPDLDVVVENMLSNDQMIDVNDM